MKLQKMLSTVLEKVPLQYIDRWLVAEKRRRAKPRRQRRVARAA